MISKTPRSLNRATGNLGFGAVVLFISSLLAFGYLDPDFRFLSSYISELGASTAPFSFWWNLIGFASVGLILSVFGYRYGLIIGDRWVSILLSLFGLGFAFAAFPIEIENTPTGFHKAHILAVCIGIASWMFGLARLGYSKKLPKTVRKRANLFAGILGIAFVCAGLELWPMPMSHRLVLAVVLLWTLLTSIELSKSRRSNL